MILTAVTGFCRCRSFKSVILLLISIVPGSVILVGLAVLLENSGLMKAGPRQAEFEPTEGKTYKFSDVHGVDEAKEVRDISCEYRVIHDLVFPH